MKIISFNICIKIDNALAVGEYLKKQDADIVCLQEVMRPLEASTQPLYRSAEIIGQALKEIYPYYFFAPEWVADHFTKAEGVPARNFGGQVEQGKLILSKYPITHGYNFFYHKDYELDSDRSNFYNGDDHGRALQVCEIEIDGKTIQVGNVHGTYSSDKLDRNSSLAQSKFILEKLGQKNLLTFLVGDFNVLPDTQSIALINEVYKNVNNEFKIQGTLPDGRQIDYAFVGRDVSVKNLSVDITDISDHYPLILEIEDF